MYMFRNRIGTLILILAMVGIILVIGEIVGGPRGLMIALVFALVFNFIAYWFSDRIALAAHRARPAPEKDYPQLYGAVRDLTLRANLPMPKVYIIPTDSPNAFATGRNPGNASVAVTTGLMATLNDRELRGVIGHELAHIRHYDILITTIAAVLASVIFFTARLLQWRLFWGSGDRRREGGDILSLIAILAVVILAPLAALLLQMAVSRRREYLADAGAAEMTSDPLGLSSALKKLDSWNRRLPMQASPAYSSLYIVNAGIGSFAGLFSTHPPTTERVRRLEEMAYPRTAEVP
jgi:heat shock protein HtpX